MSTKTGRKGSFLCLKYLKILINSFFYVSNLKIEPQKGLKETHANLITKLENLSNERDEVRLNNEDAQKRHKMSLKNKAKLEKDIERLEKQNESTKSEFERLTLKVKQLVNQNSELEQLIERKARHAQEWIQMSTVSIYCINYTVTSFDQSETCIDETPPTQK